MDKTPGIRVRLHRYGGRRAIGLIWQCGRASGEVSSGTLDEREADRAAGRLELQLEQGNLPGRSEGIALPWVGFRERYEAEWLSDLSRGSVDNWKAAANHFEAICKPKRVSDISKGMLSKFRSGLESQGLSGTTCRSYYAALRAALGWAESMDLLDRVPSIRQRKGAKTASIIRNRVISREEFERIVQTIKATRKKDGNEFERFLEGLWWSSLRLDELNRLNWNKRATLHVNLDGNLPLIVFVGGQKNKADTFLPAPPQFWKLVQQPGYYRSGPVFGIPNGRRGHMKSRSVGRRIADAGKIAGVVVDPRSGKCATAHDLRAACLTRIAAKSTMSQTQALARHSDPRTTSQFYVRHKAEELAAAMGWT